MEKVQRFFQNKITNWFHLCKTEYCSKIEAHAFSINVGKKLNEIILNFIKRKQINGVKMTIFALRITDL